MCIELKRNAGKVNKLTLTVSRFLQKATQLIRDKALQNSKQFNIRFIDSIMNAAKIQGQKNLFIIIFLWLQLGIKRLFFFKF